jgi:hypothetical protein
VAPAMMSVGIIFCEVLSFRLLLILAFLLCAYSLAQTTRTIYLIFRYLDRPVFHDCDIDDLSLTPATWSPSLRIETDRRVTCTLYYGISSPISKSDD